MFEFDTTFNVNTGELDFSYIGSGVHLYKDVTFSFSLVDPMGLVVENDSQLISNPLIDAVIFDIMDTGRNLIFPAYRSGTTSRSITITEQENESIFGSYNPNFGVKVTVTNKIGADPFISEFYAYGNKPNISNYKVYDASGLDDYNLSGLWKFNLNESLLTGFQIKTASTGNAIITWGDDPFDIIPDTVYITGENITYNSSGLNFSRSNSNLVTAKVSGHTFSSGDVITVTGITYPLDFNGIFNVSNATNNEFEYVTSGYGIAIGSGFAGVKLTKGAHYYNNIILNNVYDKIILENNFNNNLNFINIEYYDIYASEESFDEIILPESTNINPSDNPNFVYSYQSRTLEDIYKLKILPVSLNYNTPYYFKAVPYSSIGSGEPILFGPSIFEQEIEQIFENQIFETNQINITHGDSSMNIDFTTGLIDTTGLYTIDIIERGLYNTICYTTQITDSDKNVHSSELKLVDPYLASPNSGISLSEYAIINSSGISYSIQNDNSYIYLNISGVRPNAIFKLYKTSI